MDRNIWTLEQVVSTKNRDMLCRERSFLSENVKISYRAQFHF